MHTKWCHAKSMHAHNRTIVSIYCKGPKQAKAVNWCLFLCLTAHMQFNGKPQVTEVDVSSDTITKYKIRKQ
jgi:hypothetical protein